MLRGVHQLSVVGVLVWEVFEMSNNFFLAVAPACGCAARAGVGEMQSGVSLYTDEIPVTGVAGGTMPVLLITGTDCACCWMLGTALLLGTVLAALLAVLWCSGGSSRLG